MFTKTANLVIWGGVVIVLSTLVYYIYVLSNRIKIDTMALKKSYDGKIVASHKLRELEFINQDLPLNPNCKLNSAEGKIFSLKQLSDQGNKIAFVIPEGVCNVCYENTFAGFSDLIKEVKLENVIVLVPQSKLRSTIIEFNDRKVKANIYGIDYNQLGSSIAIGYVPFIFTLNKNLKYENMFVPNNTDADLFPIYITKMKKKYYDKI